MNDKALAVIPRSMVEVQSMAEILAKSSLLPDALKGKVPDVVVQILAGQELGLSPMASIRGVHIVQGKPILSADTMVALVLASGSCEYFQVVNENETSVTYETKRKGAPSTQKYTWSDEDTKAAGLNTKDNWRLHKKQMRRARCKAILARDVYPDVLAGVYEFDSSEIEEPRVIHRDIKPVTDIVDAEIVSETTEDLAKLCAEAPSLDQLEALKDRCAALPDGPKRTLVRTAYGARLKYFEQQLKATAAVPAAVPATATAAEPAA